MDGDEPGWSSWWQAPPPRHWDKHAIAPPPPRLTELETQMFCQTNVSQRCFDIFGRSYHTGVCLCHQFGSKLKSGRGITTDTVKCGQGLDPFFSTLRFLVEGSEADRERRKNPSGTVVATDPESRVSGRRT